MCFTLQVNTKEAKQFNLKICPKEKHTFIRRRSKMSLSIVLEQTTVITSNASRYG